MIENLIFVCFIIDSNVLFGILFIDIFYLQDPCHPINIHKRVHYSDHISFPIKILHLQHLFLINSH